MLLLLVSCVVGWFSCCLLNGMTGPDPDPAGSGAVSDRRVLLQAQASCGCRPPHPAASTSPRSARTAGAPSAVTTRSSATSRTSTSSRTRCTSASSATGATAPKTLSQRTRACSIAAPAACSSACSRPRPSRAFWGRSIRSRHTCSDRPCCPRDRHRHRRLLSQCRHPSPDHQRHSRCCFCDSSIHAPAHVPRNLFCARSWFARRTSSWWRRIPVS